MRICWAQGVMIAVVVVLGFSAMLSGCGAKGPLYLDKEAVVTPPSSDETEENEPTKEKP